MNQKGPALMQLMHKILFSLSTVHKCISDLQGSKHRPTSQEKLAKKLLITSMFSSEEMNNRLTHRLFIFKKTPSHSKGN